MIFDRALMSAGGSCIVWGVNKYIKIWFLCIFFAVSDYDNWLRCCTTKQLDFTVFSDIYVHTRSIWIVCYRHVSNSCFLLKCNVNIWFKIYNHFLTCFFFRSVCPLVLLDFPQILCCFIWFQMFTYSYFHTSVSHSILYIEINKYDHKCPHLYCAFDLSSLLKW